MTSTRSISAPLGLRVEVGAHLAGDVRDALVEIAPRRAEAHVTEQVLEQERQRAVVLVAIGVDAAHARERVEVGGDELDVGRDAHRAEEAPAHGAEEGLGEFRVGKLGDERGELAADPAPALALERLGAKRGAQLGDRLRHEAVVELDALHRVALAAFQSRLSKRSGARRVMARNSAL